MIQSATIRWPMVVLIGAPSVGKSTLFNYLTQTRNALVSPYPGTTRDRQLGMVKRNQHHFMLMDTGGMYDRPPKETIEALMLKQTEQAIAESDQVLFLVDAQVGITLVDEALAKRLRRLHKLVYLVVNKTERSVHRGYWLAEAYSLGLGPPWPIAAQTGQGVDQLITALFPKKCLTSELPISESGEVNPHDHDGLKLAIVGRPNAGKSTLMNTFLGEERMIVHSTAGTTHDSIDLPLVRDQQHYILMDTAGVRKRNKRSTTIERFSVVKTLQAIKIANVVLYLIDAEVGITDQDLTLIAFVLEWGSGLVIAVNKWDHLSTSARMQFKKNLDQNLYCSALIHVHYISALKNKGINPLFCSIQEANQSALKKWSTSQVTTCLQQALLAHAPPMIAGRRIKLRYAHVGGHSPLRIVIHGTAVHRLPESYKRYLARFFQTTLELSGIAIQLIFKSSQNPYLKLKK